MKTTYGQVRGGKRNTGIKGNTGKKRPTARQNKAKSKAKSKAKKQENLTVPSAMRLMIATAMVKWANTVENKSNKK
jgi:hypothetical protein